MELFKGHTEPAGTSTEVTQLTGPFSNPALSNVVHSVANEVCHGGKSGYSRRSRNGANYGLFLDLESAFLDQGY